LDVGCGGGLLAESLARLDVVSKVKGIDLTSDVLEVAKRHMVKDPALISSGKLEYALSGIENVPRGEMYDIVTMFEMLEHVPRPAEVLRHAMDHVKPGGWLFLSTINRTAVAWFTTIFAGEHLFKIVPPGTHTWKKYINESELRDWISTQPGWQIVRSDGCLFIPASGWHLTGNRSLGNYLLVAQRTH
jgi:polyprenyldihydroxybenzoate methyltransferase/3-demethylubiquinol 3-O-methyltransferase